MTLVDKLVLYSVVDPLRRLHRVQLTKEWTGVIRSYLDDSSDSESGVVFCRLCSVFVCLLLCKFVTTFVNFLLLIATLTGLIVI